MIDYRTQEIVITIIITAMAIGAGWALHRITKELHAQLLHRINRK